jgi:serine protease Do
LRARYSRLLSVLGSLALIAGLGTVAPVRAAELSSSLQQHIRAATFEVVQLKPPEVDVTYDRALPMDLIPYEQRVDKYRSIGTAFAIGPNRYVTAAHVIALGMGSQFGPPALRDGTGKVYDIDQVYKFSDHRDFVVFSLRQQPPGVQILAPGGKPALNDTVYAVGNALGQGVVIRDGLYTSDTPEEVDGQWRWLRFSAAASPGNSGGPLVDQHGKVIGVVLRKSPAENLNFALPIAELINAKDGEGRVGGRLPVRLLIIDAAETLTIDERFDLPKPLAGLYAAVLDLTVKELWGADQKLLDHNADHLFPHGAGSERLLHTNERAPFPLIMHEDPNKMWVAGAGQRQTVQLDRNGFVELAKVLVRLRVPDDVTLGTLYGDDKLYMDLLLKAYELRRTVGTDSVRVTSLGKPKSSSQFTDRWGRTWRVRDWAIPYNDQLLTVASLATPEGYVAEIFPIGSSLGELMHKTQQLLSDYVYVTMEGTLAQWQDYLAQKSVQPKAFEALRITVDDPGHEVGFRSDRYELDVKPELVKLSKDSMLYLDFGFSGGEDSATWSVNRVQVSESRQVSDWVHVARRTEPPSSLPEAFQSNWNKLKTGSFPFNGMIESENGRTIASAGMQPPGSGADAAVRYALEVTEEGVQTQQAMTRKLELLKHSVKVLEQDRKN